jgi:predicted AlkP superfamily phosphohydrolase/phosphomutase
MCDSKNEKLLIVGLDGATWDILTPVIAKGWMPFLGELKARGSSGNLESTFPCMTAPAWISFYTGTDPRTHGIFDWGVRDRDYYFNLINSTYIKNIKLWEILNQNGKRAGVINLPTTYPPERLDGVMVTGMFTPGTYADYTFPTELKDQIRNKYPHYRIDLKKGDYKNRKHRIEKFVHALIKMVRNRKLLAQWINRNNELDALILVFVEMDRLQHCLFAELKDCLDGRDHSYQVLFRDFFIELDTAIRDLYHDFRPTHFFSLSDHGFTKFAKRFYANAWLRDQGHLSIRRRFKLLSGIKSMLSRVNIDKSTIRKWLSGYKSSKLKNINLPFNVFRQSVNWSATKAFMVGSVGICLNIKGRDKKGILTCEQAGFLADQICQQLTELKVDGEKLFSRIYLKSQYVAKDDGCNIPDILLKPNNGFVISSRLEGVKEMFQASQGWDSGTHDTKGIFLAVGETIKPAFQVEEMSIVDVLPTIVYLMGLPIPDNVGGVIRRDIAEKEFVHKQAVVFREYAPMKKDMAGWSDPSEEAQIKERLEELGYL